MSGKPFNTSLIHHTIHKIKQHWNEVRANIHINDSASGYDKWLSQIPVFKQMSFHNTVCIVLWDIVTNRFVLAIDERKTVQYDMSLFTAENGVDFSLANFHPDYIHALQLMNQCILQQHAQYRHVPHDKTIANIDALYRIQNGSYIHILQQIVPVETDSSGQPILYLSYIRDITHLKKPLSASLVFTTPDENKLWNYCFTKREMEPVMPFTRQEKKVLTMLSEGKQTRHIAEQLSLSPHTVDTHRRRMLAKTNCVDTTALAAYCQMIGLI